MGKPGVMSAVASCCLVGNRDDLMAIIPESYAHSIKNPHIIHMTSTYRNYMGKIVYRYLCCQSYTDEKATIARAAVTCKNCLKILSEEES